MRYLCRHNLFCPLQSRLPGAFTGPQNAPLPPSDCERNSQSEVSSFKSQVSSKDFFNPLLAACNLPPVTQYCELCSQSEALTACRHMVSGSISLPSPGFFSPFPHGTRPLSVIRWYLALESGLPSFPQGSTCLVVLRIPLRFPYHYAYGSLTHYGCPFQNIQL